MEIRFGRPVVSVDGERVGAVEGLILDTSCRTVREILVLHGIDERAIPFATLQTIDIDGIIDVSLTAFEVQQSSLDAGEAVTGTGPGYMPFTSWVSGETMASNFEPPPQPAPGYEQPRNEEPQREGVEIDAENVVAGPDGKVVGTIAGVETDQSGRITELIIDTGFLRPDLRVEMESVEYVEGSYVSRIL